MFIETWEKGRPIDNARPVTINYPIYFDLIPETRKLRIRFQQENSRIFEANRFGTATISLEEWDHDTDKYRLTFLVNAEEQTLKSGYESPFTSRKTDMEILFDLKFTYKDDKVDETDFKGQWIDLDNVIYRIVNKNGAAEDPLYLQKAMTERIGNFRSTVAMRDHTVEIERGVSAVP